jgi:glycosyltransferase involved in cell wall biosynthesis/peptidoglycan/xylan/chitin deacetylase (PgdA/CDA1 family)
MNRGRQSEPEPTARNERAKGSARHFFMRQLLKSAAVGFPGGLLAALFLRHRGFPVFMFHRVLPDPRTSYDPEMVISANLFESFLQWASEKFHIVSVPELMRRIKEPLNGDRRYCAITFDDGWQDNYAHAFPLLQAYHAPATIFLAARLIGSERRFWQERLWACLSGPNESVINDDLAEEFNRQCLWYPPLRAGDFTFSNLRRVLLKRSSREAEEFVDLLETKFPCPSAAPGRSFMNWQEVELMQKGGVHFGSHTLNHTLLTQAPPDVAWNEITESRKELQERLGEPVTGFTYPWGQTLPIVTHQVQAAGYEYALTTQPSLFNKSSDAWLIPRVPISGNVVRDDTGYFAAELANFSMNSAAFRRSALRRAVMPINRGERLRIAYVINMITQWNTGGTERQLLHLIKSLDPAYFEPALFVLQGSPDLKAGDPPFPIHVVNSHKPFVNFRILLDLRKKLAEFKPDIVQTFFLDATLFGTLAATLAAVPVIVQSRRSLLVHQEPLAKRILLRAANRLTRSWQCNSLTVASEVEKTEGLPRPRMNVLPNVLDPQEFKPATSAEKAAARQLLGLPQDIPIFLSVGNLRAVKNHSTLIRAASLLRERLPDAIYVIVGAGELEADLKAEIERGDLGSVVRLAGMQLDVLPWLAAADMGLITSLSEGSSNALLEYMATGVPTVLSTIPSNQEMAQGVFFETRNPADLASKIYELWSNPQRREELVNKQRKIALRHSPESIARLLQAYYVNLVAQFT